MFLQQREGRGDVDRVAPVTMSYESVSATEKGQGRDVGWRWCVIGAPKEEGNREHTTHHGRLGVRWDDCAVKRLVLLLPVGWYFDCEQLLSLLPSSSPFLCAVRAQCNDFTPRDYGAAMERGEGVSANGFWMLLLAAFFHHSLLHKIL